MLDLLPNLTDVLPCPKSAGTAELVAPCFLAVISGSTNDSFWVGPTKTSLRARGAF